MNHKVAIFRRWIFRVLAALMLGWGTFAAVVAFAVRYDLGPFRVDEPSLSTMTTDRSVEGTVTRCRLIGNDITRIIAPSVVADSFLAMLVARSAVGTPLHVPNQTKISLKLDWRGLDSTAVWTATYKTGCDCPYVPDSTKTILTASINPYTAQITQIISQGIALLPQDTTQHKALTEPEVRR